MSRRIRIGICGCGEVTQVIHLPALQQLDDRFEVAALCDVSASVLAGVAARLPGVATYGDTGSLLGDSRVDAVLVATPHAYHASTTIAALRAGKHVLVEKPLAMTLEDAEAVAREEMASGRIVQVGYMRRYAGTFSAAVELVANHRGEVRFARVHDFIGANRQIIDDTSRVLRGNDISAEQQAEVGRLGADMTRAAIGTTDPELVQAYGLLLGLNSHDISAMRALLGRPSRVLHATQRGGGRYISASFDYGGFVCEFATGVDRLPRYDTFIEVYFAERVMRLSYETPYVRNLPATLSLIERDGSAGIRSSQSFPSRLDAFVLEWLAFANSIDTGTRPQTGVEDAAEDLELFRQIMALLSAERAG